MSLNKKIIIPSAMVGMMAILSPHIDLREGLELTAYRDSGGVWTICRGETVGVFPGQKKTKDECDVTTQLRLVYFGQGVSKAVKLPMTNMRWAGLTSFAYNIGLPSFGSSTLVKRLNAGDPKACDSILDWKFVRATAGGKWDMADGKRDGKANCFLAVNKSYCGGIKDRRYDEHAMCRGAYNGS